MLLASAGDTSLLPPLSELLHGVLRDRRAVIANLLQVRMHNGESRLDSPHMACIVDDHGTHDRPVQVALIRAAPMGLQSRLFNRIVYESELVLVNDTVCVVGVAYRGCELAATLVTSRCRRDLDPRILLSFKLLWAALSKVTVKRVERIGNIPKRTR
jgi:hypothetical protein